MSKEHTFRRYIFTGPVKGLADRIRKKAKKYLLLCNMDVNEDLVQVFDTELQARHALREANKFVMDHPEFIGYKYCIREVTI